MNCFTLIAVGHLARDPEAVEKPDMTIARFCLIGNDYAGRDEEGAAREVVTSMWFVAFGPIGAAILRHCRKGDQLILEARDRANNWTNRAGDKEYDHSFIVEGFRFGAPGAAKRDDLQRRQDAFAASDAQS